MRNVSVFIFEKRRDSGHGDAAETGPFKDARFTGPELNDSINTCQLLNRSMTVGMCLRRPKF